MIKEYNSTLKFVINDNDGHIQMLNTFIHTYETVCVRMEDLF